MHICIIFEQSPSKINPIYPFIDQLSKALSQQDVKITLISPQSITKFLIRGIPLNKRKNTMIDSVGHIIEIYRPLTVTFGSNGVFKWINSKAYSLAIRKSYSALKSKPDVVYTHFWHIGLITFYALKKNIINLFVASGECEIDNIFKNKNTEITNFINFVKGTICVSTKNKNESISLELTDEKKSIVLPNGIDFKLFCKSDKKMCREMLGFSQDIFIIVFVGSFEIRKGVNRISEAINKLNDNNLYSIFIGKPMNNDNTCIPTCDNQLFCGSLRHDEIPIYLNCADVFVLPTIAEGCSNSIIEALGCGLPIISSNLPFNYDVLNSMNSILIDPYNVDEIAQAIKELKNNNNKRKMLSKGALETAKNLSIELRASNIIDFIKKKSNGF